MGRMKQIGPGVSVYTEEPEGAEERASREAQEARWRRAREIGAAMRAGPFPMTLTQWARSAGVRRDEDYRDGGQIVLIRDRFLHAVCETDEEAAAYRPHDDGEPGVTARCMVIATHTSKSCVLPVVSIEPLGLNWRATLRNNFYNWKVSVETLDGREVDVDHGRLFDPTEAHNACYCEGFPADRVFGSYAADPSRFTVELDSEHEVFTLLFLLSRWSRKGGA